MKKFSDKFKSFVEAGMYSSADDIYVLKRVLLLGNLITVTGWLLGICLIQLFEQRKKKYFCKPGKRLRFLY